MLSKAKPEAAKEYDIVPFDLYCPSMKDKLKNGICEICNSYWPSKAAKDRHKKCHPKKHRRNENEGINVEENSTENVVVDKEGISETEEFPDDIPMMNDENEAEERMPIFENIFDIFQGPFTDI